MSPPSSPSHESYYDASAMSCAKSAEMSSRSQSISSEASFDEDHFSEEFFLKTYVPLSNLPTPPLSSCSTNSSRQQSPEVLLASCEVRDPELLGPAIHMTNLIPSSVSLIAPSMPLVHAILTRADLPLETIALAVCVLDSLNSKFALSWRQACPLESPPSSPVRDTFPELHIDTVHPELIAMCALIIAHKFVVDAPEPTSKYAHQWGLGVWSSTQINVTQRCLMENLDYRLKPLWEEEVLIGALEDMERAGQQYQEWNNHEIMSERDTFNGFGPHPYDGKAVQFMNQATPAMTPMIENTRGLRDVSDETKRAFTEGVQGFGKTDLRLPDARKEDPFPDYENPFLITSNLGILCSLGTNAVGEPLMGFVDYDGM